MGERLANIIAKTLEICREIPLCDRCLGRVFSTYGVGLSNKLRGLSIKTIIAMTMPYVVKEIAVEDIKKIAENIKFPPIIEVLKKMGIQVKYVKKPCYICNDLLDDIIEKYTKEILKESLNYEFENFLIGVHLPSEIISKEENILREFKVETYESIKNEIKREIGKRVKEKLNIEPEFQEPDIVFLVNLVEDRLSINVKPLFIIGKYVKLGRRISQIKWLIWNGEKYRLKYELSIEGCFQTIAETFKAEKAILHAAGREDVDVRMLGHGRPMIVELKKPKLRKTFKERLMEAQNKVREVSEGYVLVFLEGKTSKDLVKEIKEQAKNHVKTYRALILSEDRIEKHDLEILENTFNNVLVSQRTPTRVLRRRPDILREKMVYKVATRKVCENIFEAIIKCQGGLYVKELINGDQGRTNPSFSSVVGKNLKCLELDVLGISASTRE